MLVLLAPALKKLAVVGGEEPSSFPLWIIFVGVAVVVIGLGGLILLLALKKNKSAEENCPSCGKVMMSDWPQCMFCKTPRGMKKAALEFISGPMQGQTVGLDGPVTTIGTAPGSTVTLNDTGVSRKHAGIRKADGGYELADLGSSNGVYVNGEKVAKRRLQLGDVIRVGTTEMVFKS
ncbi:MAG: FHA domain-containing protein [Myxococcales bacterium]|nr:FHA domain-containing protein [Myxococcales bacterium]